MIRSSSLLRLLKGFALACVAVVALPALAQAPPAAATTATSQVTIASGLGGVAGVAVDPLGNVYAIDGVNGTLSQIIGANGATNLILPGLSAPGQVAVDAARNVYIAAGTQQVALKFTYTAGALSLNTPTNIGTGLGSVVGVAVDLTGNVYIVDATNKQVVKVTPAGVQTTIASGLVAPKQIAVDRLGNVFVADSGANSIVFIAAGSGTVSTIGTGFNMPSGVAVDQVNNLYIADTGNSAVKEIPNVAGVPTPGGQITLAVSQTAPTTIAADTRGTIYVGGGGQIVHFSPSSVYFGLIPAKQTTPVTPVTITFLQTLTPATIKVVATGTTGLDFADAGKDTCMAGMTYNAGATCVVNVTFTPLYAGPRYGAIVMYDNSNRVISRTFIGGAGLGPVITFDPGHIVSFIPQSFNAPSNIALAAPHGIKFDAAGNTFFADTNSNRVIELPANNSAPVAIPLTYTLNDMTINGAGDLVVPDLSTGRMTVVPFENGTWNFADVIIAGTGYGKPRVVNVDIAGNMYFCDVTNNRILTLTIYGVQTQLNPGLTKGCLGTAVDVYGNVAVTDTANGFYIPISGLAPYAIATSVAAPWGIVFDASGSVIIGSNTTGTFYRIPNEGGTLSNADQLALTVNKSYGITLDPTGNLFSVPTVGTTPPASGYNFNAYVRGAPISYPQPFTPVSTVACETPASTTTTVFPYGLLTSSCVSPTVMAAAGVYSNSTLFDISNSGNTAPVFTNPAGYALLGDIDDFGFGTAPAKNLAAQPYPLCSFTTPGMPPIPLQPGASCYVALGFNPQSPGLRSAIFSLPSQSTTPGVLELLGFGAGTPATGTSSLSFAQTSPLGTPGPFQDIAFTFAAADKAATGSITVTIDGTPLASAELASGVASFDIPNGLAAGMHSIAATYSGDSTHAPLTTPTVVPITVANAMATFTIATSGVSINAGQPVTISANLGGAMGEPTPTGTITFLEGTTTLGSMTLSNATASFTTNTLAAGTHTISYRYSGDSIYATGNSMTVTVTVGTFAPTTTTVSVTPVQPAGGYIYGAQLMVVATIAPVTGTVAPTGSVLFNLGGVVTTVPLAGNTATFTVTPNAGTYTLAASYIGSPTFASSTGTSSFVVVPIATATTLKASSTSFAAGSNVTLTATTMSSYGIPASGTITFRNKATVLGVINIDKKGTAVLITDVLPGGTNNVTATYSGDANDNTSTSAVLVITCSFNSTSLINNAATVLVYFPTVTVPNTINAVLSNTAPSTVILKPTGTVTFTINGMPAMTNAMPNATPPVLAMPVGPVAVSSGGVASINEPAATVDATGFVTLPTGYKYGVNTVTATYSGDSDYSPSSTTTTFNYYIVPVGTYDGDYTITATPTALPITIGNTGTGTITITPVAKYFGYVQVTCAGLPLYATCILQPDQVLLDGTGTAQTMSLTVLTQAPVLVGSVTRHQVEERLAVILGAPFLLALALGSFRRGRKAMRSAGIRGVLFLLLLSAGLGSTTACGGHPAIATPAGTYTVMITGSGSGPLNTTITDITNPLYGAPVPIVHSFPVTMTFK